MYLRSYRLIKLNLIIQVFFLFAISHRGMASEAASDPLTIVNPEQPTALLPTLNFYYTTTDRVVSPDEILSGTWLHAAKDGYRPKPEATDYWLKFTVRNESALTNEFILYQASNFILEKMSIFEVGAGKPELIGTNGVLIPHHERSMHARYAAVPTTIARGESKTYLVHVYTTRPFKADFAFYGKDAFIEHVQSRNLIYGFCIGIQSIIIVISTLFAWRLRDKQYAWFSVLSLAMILMVFVGFGFKDKAGIAAFDALNSSDLVKILRPSVTFLVLHLTGEFLSLRQRMPRLHQWIQATKISIATLVVLSFVPSVVRHAIAGADRMIFLGVILTSVASLRAWRMKVPLGGYFFVATSALILSVIPWLLVHTTGRAVPAYALDLIPMGQSLEMSVLVIALIAKVRRIDEARAAAEIEAGKNEELKTLVRVLSHDLKNPLTVIMAYAHKGREKMSSSGNGEMTKYFEKILTSSENQLAIIEHIKSMRAVQDGKSDLTLARVSLIDVLRQAEQTFEQKLLEKRLRLVYDHNGMKDVHVIAEAVSLNHNVINNLISNAIKFSHPGGTIDISVTTKDSGVSLVVEDHGIGIPKDLMANIFRADVPTSRPGTNGEQGTGFGMPVVKSYIERFGGEITIDSIPQTESPERHGTRVTISLKKAA